MEQKSALIT